MKRMLLILFLIPMTFLFAREQKVLRNHSLESFNPTPPSNREEIILFDVDFEEDVSGWTTGNSGGWELSEIDAHSPTHSFNSPDNDNDGEFSSYDLFSETISIPLISFAKISPSKFLVSNILLPPPKIKRGSFCVISDFNKSASSSSELKVAKYFALASIPKVLYFFKQ